tara:strand:+ start:10977 stop:11891 length:915 start_codon:yes stop_codon:yes gene_type:complete
MFKSITSGPTLLLILVPYCLILILSTLGNTVDTRDLDEYIYQIGIFDNSSMRLDYLSWSILNLIFGNININQDVIRIFTLTLFLFTCFVIYLKSKNDRSMYYFLLSTGFLLPVLLLSQIRLLIAICLFSIALSISRFKYFSIFLGALCHFSFALLVFFPSVFFVGVILDTLSSLSFDIPGLVRLEAYFELAKSMESGKSPIYFGWELLFISLLYLYSKNYKIFVYSFLSLIGILYIHNNLGLSIDASRRLLELAIFAYGPFMICAVPRIINNNELTIPPKFLISFMWFLMAIQTYKLIELVQLK